MDSFTEQTTDDVPMKTNKTKPVHEVRLGTIKAAVWRNETEAGVRYNATFSRLYKDGDGSKSTDSFGRDDLPTLVHGQSARPGDFVRERKGRARHHLHAAEIKHVRRVGNARSWRIEVLGPHLDSGRGGNEVPFLGHGRFV